MPSIKARKNARSGLPLRIGIPPTGSGYSLRYRSPVGDIMQVALGKDWYYIEHGQEIAKMAEQLGYDKAFGELSQGYFSTWHYRYPELPELGTMFNCDTIMQIADHVRANREAICTGRLVIVKMTRKEFESKDFRRLSWALGYAVGNYLLESPTVMPCLTSINRASYQKERDKVSRLQLLSYGKEFFNENWERPDDGYYDFSESDKFNEGRKFAEFRLEVSKDFKTVTAYAPATPVTVTAAVIFAAFANANRRNRNRLIQHIWSYFGSDCQHLLRWTEYVVSRDARKAEQERIIHKIVPVLDKLAESLGTSKDKTASPKVAAARKQIAQMSDDLKAELPEDDQLTT